MCKAQMQQSRMHQPYPLSRNDEEAGLEGEPMLPGRLLLALVSMPRAVMGLPPD